MLSARPVPVEPHPARYAHRAQRWFFATRPAFLSLSLGGVMMGLAAAGPALRDGWPKAALATLLALLCHAAANVINDVADDANGTDAANVTRLYPYTGGSRFIQNGVLSRCEMQALAWVLFAAVLAGGLLLTWLSGWMCGVIGLVGVMLAWGYSASPLRLNSRGLGEVALCLAFGLVPLGACSLFLPRLPGPLWPTAGAYGLLACALLFVNQLADRPADALAGKHHWGVRLSGKAAATVFVLLNAGALLLAGLAGLPLWLCGLLAVATCNAWRLRPVLVGPTAGLRPAIHWSILAANLYPLLAALALLTRR